MSSDRIERAYSELRSARRFAYWSVAIFGYGAFCVLATWSRRSTELVESFGLHQAVFLNGRGALLATLAGIIMLCLSLPAAAQASARYTNSLRDS
jgi:hypothetical protein